MPRYFLLALCWVVAHLGVAAFPTLYGPTGLVTLPDAGIVASPLALAADVDDLPGRRTLSVRANGALARGEVGAFLATETQTTWGVNGKYPLAAWSGGQLAAGAFRQLAPDTTTTQCYLAGSHRFSRKITGTLGATWTEVAGATGAAAAVRPYVGLTLQLSRDLRVVGEYQAASDALFESRPLRSLLIIRQADQPVSLTVGTSNALSTLGGARDYLFAGMVVQVGGGTGH